MALAPLAAPFPPHTTQSYTHPNVVRSDGCHRVSQRATAETPRRNLHASPARTRRYATAIQFMLSNGWVSLTFLLHKWLCRDLQVAHRFACPTAYYSPAALVPRSDGNEPRCTIHGLRISSPKPLQPAFHVPIRTIRTTGIPNLSSRASAPQHPKLQ